MEKYILICLVLVFTCCSWASQEGILPFSSFHLESEGIGSSGLIIVKGKNDSSGALIQLIVTAFSKKINVPKSLLDKVSKIHSNGIQLSYEPGYKKLGGKTLYILFQKGFTSSTKAKTILSIKENGVSKLL